MFRRNFIKMLGGAIPFATLAPNLLKGKEETKEAINLNEICSNEPRFSEKMDFGLPLDFQYNYDETYTEKWFATDYSFPKIFEQVRMPEGAVPEFPTDLISPVRKVYSIVSGDKGPTLTKNELDYVTVPYHYVITSEYSYPASALESHNFLRAKMAWGCIVKASQYNWTQGLNCSIADSVRETVEVYEDRTIFAAPSIIEDLPKDIEVIPAPELDDIDFSSLFLHKVPKVYAINLNSVAFVHVLENERMLFTDAYKGTSHVESKEGFAVLDTNMVLGIG